MIEEIGGKLLPEMAGAKAASLGRMKQEGFPVPAGIVLTRRAWEYVLEEQQAAKSLESILDNGVLSLAEKSDQLTALLKGLQFPEKLTNQILNKLDKTKHYAVRSSGFLEDLAGYSFAGQYDTFLNVPWGDSLIKAIVDCYASLGSQTVLSYLENRRGNTAGLGMAVIIQEMVAAEKSGVLFTVNPLTGADQEMLIEAGVGLGAELVSGRRDGERYRYSWLTDTLVERGGELLAAGEIVELVKQALQAQVSFGYPLDLEFAFAEGQLYLLQARPITKISYTGLADWWSTADFKDGGVSATVCKPLMWSLYEAVWDSSLKQFILDSALLKETDLRKLSQMYYGRPYWNMSVVKLAMSVVPGYKERNFDEEFGVTISYVGDGQTTKYTPQSIAKIARIALRQMKMLAQRVEQAEALREELLVTYEGYQQDLAQNRTQEEWEQIVSKLIREDYMRCETTYFTQIFFNTIHQALFKETIYKLTDDNGYFALLSGLNDVSHLRPFYQLWEISRVIDAKEEVRSYWQATPVDEIAADFAAGKDLGGFAELQEFLEQYGYHSQKELDLSYPSYCERPDQVVQMLKETVMLEQAYDPQADQQRLAAVYARERQRLAGKMSRRKYRKLAEKIEKMRQLLWWREEFKDCSTRYYHMIRQYVRRLAETYWQAGILTAVDDIWFLKLEDLQRFIDRQIDAAELRRIIARNQRYYQSFRHYENENEIGPAAGSDFLPVTENTAVLKGVGSNSGVVTGTARVVRELAEIGRLQPDDILVTRFTDTGWTSKFACLKGVVTEYGGMLCHAAIVSREYGIPCVVCLKGAMERIADGSTITVNGTTGEVVIEK